MSQDKTKAMVDKMFLVGVDVGSTTVKIVVRRHKDMGLLHGAYVRHESRQADVTLQELRAVEAEFGLTEGNARLYFTGSGGAKLSHMVGACYAQEVTAVGLAVERLHPEAHSVIELGGQDAKIIAMKQSPNGGGRQKFASMNDKCAGGTGAIIERIAGKLGLFLKEVAELPYDGVQLHPVAGKCGVFAETDVVGLLKLGVPANELAASLFDAIVQQNLGVLTRGRQLLPQTILLGGPNTYLRGLREAWRRRLFELWRRENISAPELQEKDWIVTPHDSTLYGAMGAIEYGLQTDQPSAYMSMDRLSCELSRQNISESLTAGCTLVSGDEDLHAFLSRHAPTEAVRRKLHALEPVFLGIDGGSTSIKAVCISPEGELLASAYKLTKSDPIADAISVLVDLRRQFSQERSRPMVICSATTGYSRSLLQKVFGLDHALVETVAHAKSALEYFPEADVIVDVGGQDIKILRLDQGVVRDFRLNTQCSAGNGYFLQAAAESLGVSMEDFADVAFHASRAPIFSYGCAVFLQSDIVNFQRQGRRPEEIIAGLAEVLPKNIFLYVGGVSNVAMLGRRFLLQGGTQRNLAVVKAEEDFLRSHFQAPGEPLIQVHPHCGEAGAIGAALYAREMAGDRSRFVALTPLIKFATRLRTMNQHAADIARIAACEPLSR